MPGRLQHVGHRPSGRRRRARGFEQDQPAPRAQHAPHLGQHGRRIGHAAKEQRGVDAIHAAAISGKAAASACTMASTPAPTGAPCPTGVPCRTRQYPAAAAQRLWATSRRWHPCQQPHRGRVQGQVHPGAHAELPAPAGGRGIELRRQAPQSQAIQGPQAPVIPAAQAVRRPSWQSPHLLPRARPVAAASGTG